MSFVWADEVLCSRNLGEGPWGWLWCRVEGVLPIRSTYNIFVLICSHFCCRSIDNTGAWVLGVRGVRSNKGCWAAGDVVVRVIQVRSIREGSIRSTIRCSDDVRCMGRAVGWSRSQLVFFGRGESSVADCGVGALDPWNSNRCGSETVDGGGWTPGALGMEMDVGVVVTGPCDDGPSTRLRWRTDGDMLAGRDRSTGRDKERGDKTPLETAATGDVILLLSYDTMSAITSIP